jgi:hypothetical protein
VEPHRFAIHRLIKSIPNAQRTIPAVQLCGVNLHTMLRGILEGVLKVLFGLNREIP